jgi:hypothetical protein
MTKRTLAFLSISVLIALSLVTGVHAAEVKLTASDGAAGDWFGGSVALAGDYALVGAHYDDDNGYWSGSAYLFRWDGSSWTEQQKLLASDGAAYDMFGGSVALAGDYALYALVGADLDDDNGDGSGSAYIYDISPVDTLDEYIAELPTTAFTNNPDQRKKALSEKLEEVRLMIEAGEYEEAIDKLKHDIRAKADGSLGGNPRNDWITDEAAQEEICAMIDELIAYLESLL